MKVDRRTIMAAGASALLSGSAEALPTRANNVVFLHGLFADGSCWSDVILRLQAAGFACTSVQHPLTDLNAAVAAAGRVVARQQGPTVLVSHSFGGVIASQVGVDPRVSALVYVAARAPDAGEDFAALAARFATPPATAGIVYDGEEGTLSEAAFLRDFAGDVPASRARVLHAVQQPFAKRLLEARTSAAAWRGRPNFYAVSALDRTIDPDLQRFMARRMGARTVELQSGHLSPVSRPDAIARLVAAAAVERTR